MQLNTVVLPAPFGPISAVMWPLLGRERQVVDGGEAAEAHGQVVDAEDRVARRSSVARP